MTFIDRYISVDVLFTSTLGCHIKSQFDYSDGAYALDSRQVEGDNPSKSIREGGLRFLDKQLILNLACSVTMRFCHFMNHIRTALSEPSSMVLTLSEKRELVTLPFSSYI